LHLRQIGRPTLNLEGLYYEHDDIVEAVSVNQFDRRTILTASWDATVKLWDLYNQSGPSDSSVSTFVGHDGPVFDVKWCPSAAKKFATTSKVFSIFPLVFFLSSYHGFSGPGRQHSALGNFERKVPAHFEAFSLRQPPHIRRLEFQERTPPRCRFSEWGSVLLRRPQRKGPAGYPVPALKNPSVLSPVFSEIIVEVGIFFVFFSLHDAPNQTKPNQTNKNRDLLAIASDDPKVTVVNLKDSSVAYESKEHQDYVRSLSWTTDGQVLLSGSWDSKILAHSLKV